MTQILQQAGPPSAAELAQPQAARTWKAAQDFEAVTLTELLKPMFETVDPASGTTGGGMAESTWRPLLTQEIARHLARHGGLGLAAPVYQQMLRMQERR